MSDAGRNLKTN